MNDADASPETLLARLARQQKRHRRAARRVESARAELERRQQRLVSRETRLAAIEGSLAEARKQEGPAEPTEALTDVLLVFNPEAGRDGEDNAVRLANVVSGLRAHGLRAQVEVKTSGKAVRARVREAVAKGGGLVVVAAGDGTIGDVATELVGSDTVLGIVPIGTMNNLARSLGVPLAIDEACALIGMRTTRRIDAGRVSSAGGHKAEHFFDCAGVGMLAVAAVAGQAFEKRRWRVLPGAIRKFFEAKRGTMQVELDGRVLAASTSMVTVSNAPIMGNKLLCAPDAKMDDGLFDIAVYDGMGDVALAAHFLAAAAGKSDSVPNYRARSIRITAEEAVASTSDMKTAPARHVIEIAVVPRAVTVIVGNGIGLSDPVTAAPLAPAFAPNPPIVSSASARTQPEAVTNGV